MAVTDAQVKTLRKWLQGGASLRKAALRSDMDRKTARKYRRSGELPSGRRRERVWRTRSDPLWAVWPELEAELARAPGLQANTLLEIVQQRYPGKYPDTVLRTLQRRVKRWRALQGPAKEVYFAQVHEPGRLAASDFTHMKGMGVTIASQRFDHLLYHFVLTYSNWEHVTVCFSESFASLSEGLQNALWALGGVPARHRTDCMTLAVHQDGNAERYTQNYRALMGHYRLEPEATNPAQAHENGDCEQSHRRFKEAVEQGLLVRGSRDFASRLEYEAFLQAVQERRNLRRRLGLAEEVGQLRPLPGRRLESLVRLAVKVGRGSTIRVQHNTYAVPARLIGEWVEARVGVETIEVWYAEQLQVTLPRLRGSDKRHIDYRYLIDWLERKPGAFARYVYQADLFPTSRFRQAYDELVERHAERAASREYVGILALAARRSESGVDGALARLLAEGRGVSVAAVEELLVSDVPLSVTALVRPPTVDLHSYDELLPNWAPMAGTAPALSAADESMVSLERLAIVGRKEACDGGAREGEPGGMLAGAASTDDAARVRGGGAASGAGVVGLCRLPERVGGARGATASAESDQPALEGLAAALGEELAESGPEAAADQGGTAVARSVVGGLPGPARERPGVRDGWKREDAQPLCLGPGVGAARPADPVHDDQSLGAGTAQGQTGPNAQDAAQATESLGRFADRRPGLCPASTRGNGGAVHAPGGTLRARERAGDEQPGILAVGADLQGPDDDGGGHRPADPSLRDLGAERVELPGRGRQEGPAVLGLSDAVGLKSKEQASVGTGPGRRPAWGPGSTPLACATLRLAPFRQAPTPEEFINHPWGFVIVAKGEM
jgi:transposase